MDTNQNESFRDKKQESRCRDPLFALLFYANVIIITAFAIRNGGDAFNVDENDNNNDDDVSYEGFMYVACASAGVGAVLSGLMFVVLLCIPSFLIKSALLFNVAATGLSAVASFMYGSAAFGIIMLFFFAIFCCYAYAVWSRIPFATANLVTGVKAIRSNCGVIIISYLFTALAIGWTLLWSLVVVGTYSNENECDVNEQCGPNYFVMFMLFLSYFFTHQVLQNTVHVIVAGVVGTWWFVPDEAKGCCSSAVSGSTIRALTTSFGSICFGSLIVAIIQAVRQLVEAARQNDDIGNMLACCIDCILGCLESLIEYFNKWAYVYVGLYGYGYMEAGKNVMTLFKDRGWEAIIADDLVGMALGMVSLVVGLITGAIALIYEDQTSWFDEYNAAGGTNPEILSFILGFVVGLVICSVALTAVASAVNAVIVLFAEGPAEFEANWPELSRKMRDAYEEAHPGYSSVNQN